jgi:NurA-like 5'-3' nuclease
MIITLSNAHVSEYYVQTLNINQNLSDHHWHVMYHEKTLTSVCVFNTFLVYVPQISYNSNVLVSLNIQINSITNASSFL